MKDNKLTCLLERWYISVPAHYITNVDDANERKQTDGQH
jgi:hypothetical protein